MLLSPLDEYTTRLAARTVAHVRWLRLDERLSYARLVVVATFVVIGWLAFWMRAISPGWIGLPVVAFIALAVWHDRVIRARDAAARAIAFYERGIARIEDRWAGGGDPGLRFRDEEHLYAQDLDLFGPASLFELLSIARTHAGGDQLAAWLKAPSELSELRLRQEAIEELRGRLDLREAIALAGNEIRSIDTESLSSWATRPALLRATWARVVAPVLALGAVWSGIWWMMEGPIGPFLIAAGVEAVFARSFGRKIRQVVHSVDRPSGELDVLVQALLLIEREPVSARRLTSLRATLESEQVSASAAIKRLHRLSEMHDWQHNLVFGIVAPFLLWSTQIALAIEAWRRQFGSDVPKWIQTLGEYEALGSLAAYAYEHPADPFPAFIDDGPGTFAGIALGHPLVPALQMVRNDVTLGDVRLFVVSGSNMSGKSTLLRTVGINIVLALAGAPVRAERLALTSLNLGATLRIQDSLQAGRSRFFAEISRVRQIVDLARSPRALLFLLDELLQGTNSHDRAIGAAAVLRTLVERGAIGLITTHDLALTAMVDDFQGRATNVHFEDHFDRGELVFDYRMRPGPVTRSNALALMRTVGLEVNE
ncbi:MAG TPA: hypothetical protein VH701_20820 [Vicinamibacterales bacterium]